MLEYAVLLFFSVAFEVIGDFLLKVGANRTLVTLAGYAVFLPSVFLFANALNYGRFSTTYTVWAVGAISANTLVGHFVFRDAVSFNTILGFLFGIVSISLLVRK